MNSLERSLQDHPAAMLRAIADSLGVGLSSNNARQMAEQIAGALSDSVRLREVLEGCSAGARLALNDLLRADGSLLVAAFTRRHGAIRLVGPGHIERERPHAAPASPAEELWYRGLIYRAFAATADGAAEVVYVPGDLAARLPDPGPWRAELQLSAAAAPAGDRRPESQLVQDCCTVLCLVQAGRVRLRHAGVPMAWRTNHLYELNQLLLHPAADAVAITQSRSSSLAALALTLATELGWTRAESSRLRLGGRAVQAWLDSSRGAQRRALLEGWRSSTLWNDLWRVPQLWCEDTGGWANDPVATRERLLALLAGLEAGAWYRLPDLVAAVKQVLPDFQRPDGNYQTWYLRRRAEPAYLRGFESWDDVEGELLRYLFAGPLHWLGAVDLGGDPGPAESFRLTAAGAAWLAGEPPPVEAAAGRLAVGRDFSVVVAVDAPLRHRFRVARFTSWTRGGPPFRYRITQSGLRRAARQGVQAAQILAFLEAEADGEVPDNVARALQRWEGG